MGKKVLVHPNLKQVFERAYDISQTWPSLRGGADPTVHQSEELMERAMTELLMEMNPGLKEWLGELGRAARDA